MVRPSSLLAVGCCVLLFGGVCCLLLVGCCGCLLFVMCWCVVIVVCRRCVSLSFVVVVGCCLVLRVVLSCCLSLFFRWLAVVWRCLVAARCSWSVVCCLKCGV